MPVDNHVKQMMEELGKALVQAIRTSSDISEAIRKIRHQGFAPQLILSCEQDGEPELRGVDFRPSRPSASPRAEIEATEQVAPDISASERGARQPEFRLNGRDVSLLKSLGIDPTRRARRPRHSRRRP